MEYFIGAATTFVMLYFLFITFKKHKNIEQKVHIKYNQSYLFETVRPFISNQITMIPMPMTQAMRDIEKNTLRILYFESKAYWIEENTLFEAEAPYGNIDKESVVEVDTMAMDDVQLKRTMFIVEKLREGLQNDLGYPGDTQI